MTHTDGLQDSEKGISHVARLLGVQPDHLVGGLNLVQAGAVLGVGASTVRQRALHGSIGCQRDGRSWRFFWWHLADYLVARECHASTVTTADQPGDHVHAHAHHRADVESEARELGLLDNG